MLTFTQFQAVRNVLTQAYGSNEAVTDELVDVILKPGLLPGAVHVFLDFISYSKGSVSLMQKVKASQFHKERRGEIVPPSEQQQAVLNRNPSS